MFLSLSVPCHSSGAVNDETRLVAKDLPLRAALSHRARTWICLYRGELESVSPRIIDSDLEENSLTAISVCGDKCMKFVGRVPQNRGILSTEDMCQTIDAVRTAC